jgi:hypothetical protein
MARAISLVTALVAGLLLAPAVSAAPQRLAIGQWRAVSGAERLLLSDDQYVVTRSGAGVVRVLDIASGSGRRLASPPCDNGPALPRAIGSALLVWECASLVDAGGHILVVDDLANRRRFIPAGAAQLQKLEMQSADGSRFHVRSVGDHWIYLTRSGYHYSDDVLVGLAATQIVHQPAQSADVTVDPARPSGTRRLCAGIRRGSGDIELGGLPFDVVDYHRPYAITSSGRLQRCAGAPPVPTGRLVAALSDTHLGWATGRLLYIRATTSAPTTRRRAPGNVRSVALTRRFVYITTGSGIHRRVFRAPIRAR